MARPPIGARPYRLRERVVVADRLIPVLWTLRAFQHAVNHREDVAATRRDSQTLFDQLVTSREIHPQNSAFLRIRARRTMIENELNEADRYVREFANQLLNEPEIWIEMESDIAPILRLREEFKFAGRVLVRENLYDTAVRMGLIDCQRIGN